ncbi:hypothetical protein D3C81_2159320 [compost metagenome]
MSLYSKEPFAPVVPDNPEDVLYSAPTTAASIKYPVEVGVLLLAELLPHPTNNRVAATVENIMLI